MAETLIYQKGVDQSTLSMAITIPVEHQRRLFEGLGFTLRKGDKRKTPIFIGDEKYEATLTNVGLSEDNSWRNDIVQIRYSNGSPIAFRLNEIFAASAIQIKELRPVTNRKQTITIPDQYKEYIDIYASDDGTLRFQCNPLNSGFFRERFVQYIGPSNSIVGYQNSTSIIFLQSLLSQVDETGKARTDQVADQFRQFYINRKKQGLAADVDVDQRIEQIESSSLDDVLDVILENPYQTVNSKGFVDLQKIDGEEYFVLIPQLVKELSGSDIDSLKNTLETKKNYYFNRIDTPVEDTDLRSLFLRLLNDYQECRHNQSFANNALGKWMRKTVPKVMESLSFLKNEKFVIKGSVGQGAWATVPWVCIFDKRVTTSAQHGVYIVYLLAEDGQTLYLTLNQGCTDYLNQFGRKRAIEELHNTAQSIKDKIPAGSFASDADIVVGNECYEEGCIFYRAYHKGNVPENETLIDDLREMVEIYETYVAAFISQKDLKKTWLITWNANLDKWDDFDHISEQTKNGQSIKWWWDVEDIYPKINDQIFLMEIGRKAQGIIACGSVEDTKKGSVFIRFDRILNYKSENILTLDLLQREIPSQVWNLDQSNIDAEIKKEYTEKLLEIWNQVISQEGVKMEEYLVSDEVTRIAEYIAAKGFSYEKGLIENLYLCLKSKPFVILAGISGTGKTKLVKLFAEAIGATSDNGRFKLVPVRPNWSDSSDLFGYKDINGNDIAGVMSEIIYEASAHTQKPYFLCLDEMNLARVEYYMSDLLSIMETRHYVNNKIITDAISMVPDTSVGKKELSKDHKKEFTIPENLYLIGTVNMDETTFPFSKKVLDRANTIELSYVDLALKQSIGTADMSNLQNHFLKSEYLVLAECTEGEATIQDTNSILQNMNDALVAINGQFGYRVRDEICFYLLYNEKYALMDKSEAMDNCILQKILPRIQGDSLSIKGALMKLFRICAKEYKESLQIQEPVSDGMFGHIESSAVTYPKSAKKIAFMIRRYEQDGYTSFWI